MSVAELLFFVLFSLPFLAVGLGTLGGGLYVFYSAGKRVIGTTHASLTDPVDPSDAPSGAHATVTGRAVEGPNGLLTTPFSSTDALGYQYAIEQETDEVGWWDIYSETNTEQFTLEGPADRLLVDPGETLPDETRETDISTGSAESLPTDVRTRLEESDHLDIEDRPQILASAVEEPRRYSESTFEPGQKLYVYGYITEDATPGIDASQSNEFRIGTEPPSGLTGEDKAALGDVAGSVVFGLFLLVFGVMFTGAGLMTLTGAIAAAL